MRTGTADYFDKVLRRVAHVPGCAELMAIGIDTDFAPTDTPSASALHGVPVLDHRAFEGDVPVGTTRVFFLANNDHHAYVHAALARQNSLAHGKIIALIHDPCAFMVSRFMTGNGAYRFSAAELLDAVSGQYGAAAKRLLAARLEGEMPDIFEFVTHAQKPALGKAHEIWVHSLYGLVKLIGESELPAHRLPKIRVCAHPQADGEPGSAEPVDGAAPLRIGVFGWVTPPKRVTAVIRGLALACDRLDPAAAGIELVVVGRRPPESSYDPAGEAARFDVAERVRFVDYPDAEEFARLQADCDLIFNLRYPSCGESSGTLASAAATTARIVTSRYQAFHESPGQRSVTTLPILEDWEIAAAICEAHEAVRKGRPAKADRPAPAPQAICPVEKLLLCETLARRHLPSIVAKREH
jgi:hypothetical protein